jgi:hypothetical protein
MPKYAKIKDGKVDVIYLADKAPDETFELVPEDVFGGHIKNPDGSFSPPAPQAPTPEEIEEQVKKRVSEIVMGNPELSAIALANVRMMNEVAKGKIDKNATDAELFNVYQGYLEDVVRARVNLLGPRS